jgi:Mn2+/Fe2+ NRAMP family transporter
LTVRGIPAFNAVSRTWITFRDRIQRTTVARHPVFRFLSILGPGLVAANAGNDAGGIATYASAGASYGFDLLWMLALITVSLILVQEMCARMGAVTGKGLSELIREEFGPRWTVFAMVTLLIANALTTISEFAGIAAAMELFGVSRYLVVPLSGVAIWWLVARGSYSRVERVFLLMTLAFFAYPITAFVAHPNWLLVAERTAVPVFHTDSGSLFMFVATIGTTITPYMQIFIQSSIVDKGITTGDYPYERAEVVFGSIFSNLIAFFIIVTTAATLHSQNPPATINTAADAARALAPLAGRYAAVLFGIGLIGASMLAAGVLPLATAFSITEAFGWEKGLSTDPSEAPIFYYLFTSMIVLGVLVTLLPGLPLIQLLLVVQVVNCMLLPPLLVFIVLLSGSKRVMGNHRNSPLFNLLSWATVALVGGMALLLLVITTIGPLLGFGG